MEHPKEHSTATGPFDPSLCTTGLVLQAPRSLPNHHFGRPSARPIQVSCFSHASVQRVNPKAIQ